MPVRNMAFFASFRKHFHTYAGTAIALLIISIVGLLSISWFRGNYLISAGDFSMPFDRIKSFIANFYSWDPSSLGSTNPRILAFTFPVYTYFALSEVIGISLVNAEKILFYGIFTLSGLSMYYMTVTLLNTKSSKFKNLAGLISGLFYMLNPYVAINILPLRQVSYAIYALFPLALALFIKGLNSKKIIKSALLAVFPLLVATSVFVDPSFVPLVLFPLFLYLLFYLVTNPNRASIYRALKFSLTAIVIWVLLDLYWLIPDLYSASSQFASVANTYASLGMSFQSIVQLNSAPLAGAFRLLGYWALDSGYKGDAFILWGSTYQSSIFVLIGFVIPLLAFIPLLIRPRDKHVIFFALFAIISLFLINGDNSSLGKWIYSSIPYFSASFNTVYLRFGMYLTMAYAFLIGIALAEFFSYLTSHFPKNRHITRQIRNWFPIILILFLIVGVYAFPLWTGEVIRPDTAVLPGNRYQLPSYYQDASEWLGTDASNFNIVVFPISTLGYGELKWPNGSYGGPYPAESLFPKAVISSSSDGNGLAGQAAQLIVENSTVAAGKLLASMNIKYVMFNEDANWVYIENNTSWIWCSPEQFQSTMSSTGAFTFEKTFGQLLFYRNNYWQPTDVYSATTSILSNGNLDQLTQIEEKNDFTPSNSVILLSSQLAAQQISDIPINTEFIQSRNLNSVYTPVSSVQNAGRLVYTLNPQPFVTARYYSGWKGVVSTNGQGDTGMIIFSSPSQCPYLSAFPDNFTYWNSYDSTLIYIKTPSPLTINSITADGISVTAWAWWQTGTSWTTGWPITIPSNQNAIIQVNQQASNITLQTNNGPIVLTVTNGWTNPLTTENPYGIPMTIFTPNATNYLLSIDVATGYDYGNLTIKIDNQFYNVDLNSQEQGPIFAYKYIGPLHLTAGYHTITTFEGNGSIPQIDSMLLYSLKNGESFVSVNNLLPSNQPNSTSLTYQEINPTEYTVHVNASAPFYLVFSESYDNGWVATVNGQQIPDQYHFTADGYANGWYITKTGTYTITLYFTPQNLFYAGAAISIATLIVCTVYLSRNKIKSIYQKHFKKKSSVSI